MVPEVGNLIVIDDLADRDHHCDLLLDQNLGRLPASYAGRVPEGCVCLTGTRYALLRDEFRQWRDRRPPESRTGCIRRILVTLGGADPDNVTGEVLSALSHCELAPGILVDIVMGHSSPHLAAVRAQVRELPFRATVTVGATNMAERMVLADLAIGAAGATTWERCCLGLPSLVVAIAANQRTFLRVVAEQGLSAVADLSDLDAAVCTFVGRMQAEPDQYFAMVDHASAAVDGLGASRVADYMLAGQEVGA
jgi:UDP-2,4-diacetamido-2,4,6-trideoxy-beta-L-altropyranose hydrolase